MTEEYDEKIEYLSVYPFPISNKRDDDDNDGWGNGAILLDEAMKE